MMKLDAHTTMNLPTGLPLAAASAGQIQVLDGPVWLTVAGATEDWVLRAGERLQLPAGARVFAGPWQAGATARLAWTPLRHAVAAH